MELRQRKAVGTRTLCLRALNRRIWNYFANFLQVSLCFMKRKKGKEMHGAGPGGSSEAAPVLAWGAQSKAYGPREEIVRRN